METISPAELDEFTPTELQHMWRAGEISRHGIPGFEFYLPLDEPPTLRDRARSLWSVRLEGRVVSGAAARWVYLGGSAPGVVEITRRSWRATLDLPGVAPRYGTYAPREVRRLAGLTITSPARTILDALEAGEFAAALELIAGLPVVHAIDVVDAVDVAHGPEQSVEMRRVTHLERELRDRQPVA